MNLNDLQQQRDAAANQAFEDYDFLDAGVEPPGGWEYVTPGTEMTRPVFLAPVEEDEGTEKVTFTVRFKGVSSAEVVEAYAITRHGNIFGVAHLPRKGLSA